MTQLHDLPVELLAAIAEEVALQEDWEDRNGRFSGQLNSGQSLCLWNSLDSLSCCNRFWNVFCRPLRLKVFAFESDTNVEIAEQLLFYKSDFGLFRTMDARINDREYRSIPHASS